MRQNLLSGVRPELDSQGGFEFGQGDQVSPSVTGKHRRDRGVVQSRFSGYLPEASGADGFPESAGDLLGVPDGRAGFECRVRPGGSCEFSGAPSRSLPSGHGATVEDWAKAKLDSGVEKHHNRTLVHHAGGDSNG